MAYGIYLDNSTTAKPSLQTASKVTPFLTEMWGTPSAPHRYGNELISSLTESYKPIYQLLGAHDTDTFVFTSSGAEAINQVVNSTYFQVTCRTGKNQYLTSLLDEAPGILALERLQNFDCVYQQVLPSKEGKITAEILSKSISPRTALISLSWANGLTGTINDIQEIASLCKQRGILFHLDITHVLGKLYFEVADIDAHFFTFNGGPLHAPNGCGGLLIKSGTQCSPFILGGLEQAGLRGGHFNVGLLAALGQAAKETLESRDYLCTEIARLRDKLEMDVVAHYPEAIPFYCTQERLPHCATIAFPGIANEAMLYSLNRRGVYASIGGGNFQQLSQLLLRSGVPDAIAQTAVSFSLSRETTDEDIERAVFLIAESAKQLKNNWRES